MSLVVEPAYKDSSSHLNISIYILLVFFLKNNRQIPTSKMYIIIFPLS